MKDESNIKVRGFPIRLLTGAVILSGAVSVGLLWSACNSYRIVKKVETRDLRIAELQGTILHLDEVLTMSARMAAATGDLGWERRYRQFEPQLDQAVKEAIQLTSGSGSAAAAAQTDAANLKLVEMENHSFALVRGGQSEEARAVLSGEAYQTQKKIYADGMVKFIRQLKEDLLASQQRMRRGAIFSCLGAVASIGLLLVTWWTVLGRLNQWRAGQARSYAQLAQAEDELRHARDFLEQRVEERTTELQQEVAERKQTEQRLQESLRSLAAINAVLDRACIIAMTDVRGVITHANDNFCKISGYSREELLGRNHRVLKSAEHPAAFFQHMWGAIAKGGVWRGEIRNRAKQGQTYWVDTTIGPMLDEEGKPKGYLAIRTDITERKRIESEVAEMNQQMIDASRQAGMAEIATGVLHNVGNVLNSVNVSATLLADQLRKTPAADLNRVVTLLREQGANLGAFFTSDPRGPKVADFLAQLADKFTRQQESQLKEVSALQKNVEHVKDIVAMQQSYAKVSGLTENLSPVELIEDAIRMNAGSFQKHEVELVRELAADLPRVCVDKHKVLQILVNLLRNAKHACDDAGRPDKRITVGARHENGRVRITITDNGVGIPPGNLNRIFNHGFTTRKTGHGFGLHSAANAAKEMDGSLAVHSDGPGRGAAFTLELPVERGGEAVVLNDGLTNARGGLNAPTHHSQSKYNP